jgi:hypothetical protein
METLSNTATPSVLHKKKIEKKFDIKIKFFKIRETSYLLAEKDEGRK